MTWLGTPWLCALTLYIILILCWERPLFTPDSINRQRTPIVIMCMHRPMYSSARKGGSNHKLRSVLEPLLEEFNVQFVFTGHDHSYVSTPARRSLPSSGSQIALSSVTLVLPQNCRRGMVSTLWP